MKKIIVANWKSNPEKISTAISLARASDKKGAVIAPPHIYLDIVGKTLNNAFLGAQDVFWEKYGPYTGEVSLSQLKNGGVKYIIIGHSERRKYLNETDEMINKKVVAILEENMKVILCVGDTADVHKKGISAVKRHIEKQLKADLKNVSQKMSKNLYVAYEPIWAISTSKSNSLGKADTPEDAVRVISYIKNVVDKKIHGKNIKVLYGGSINIKNVKEFLFEDEINGLLVGGASLRPKEFSRILSLI